MFFAALDSERNRQHAKRSRQRKREFLNALEQSIESLKAENGKLMAVLGISPDNTVAVSEREDEMDAAANERFMDSLKQPQNRVLNDEALSSLRELFR